MLVPTLKKGFFKVFSNKVFTQVFNKEDKGQVNYRMFNV